MRPLQSKLPGLETINFKEVDTLKALRELTANEPGHAPDVVIEAVGFHYCKSWLHSIEVGSWGLGVPRAVLTWRRAAESVAARVLCRKGGQLVGSAYCFCTADRAQSTYSGVVVCYCSSECYCCREANHQPVSTLRRVLLLASPALLCCTPVVMTAANPAA